MENSPKNLLKQYNCDSLEDVFLQVCRDVQRKKRARKARFVSIEGDESEVKPAPVIESEPTRDEFVITLSKLLWFLLFD